MWPSQTNQPSQPSLEMLLKLKVKGLKVRSLQLTERMDHDRLYEE